MAVTVAVVLELVDDWSDDWTKAACCAGRRTMDVSDDKENVLESAWQSVVLTPQTKVLLLPPLVQGVIAISALLSSIPAS